MKPPLNFCFDLDGPFADWGKHFAQFVPADKRHLPLRETVEDYAAFKRNVIKQDPGYLLKLERNPEGLAFLLALMEVQRNFADDDREIRFHVVSSIDPDHPDPPRAQVDKLDWVEDLANDMGIVFHEILMVRSGSEKATVLKEGHFGKPNTCILIDNSLSNCEHWVKAGGKALHFFDGVNGHAAFNILTYWLKLYGYSDIRRKPSSGATPSFFLSTRMLEDSIG